MEEQAKYFLALGKNPHIGPSSFKKIRDLNIDLAELFSRKPPDLKRMGLGERLVKEISYVQRNYSPEDVVSELSERKIKYLIYGHADYPELLKEIYDPPGILYFKGYLPDSLYIGMVGSRNPTDYGRAVTKEISNALAERGIVIVSGLALGIDSIAHKSAIDAKGKTIAVLGSGLDRIYPEVHRELADEIVKNGAIISEYPPGTPPLKQHFPARNRIISGISSGLVVTEAAERSGSLITARSALEQNREVFAIPGAIDNKNSFGPNELIKMGAKVVTTVDDILEELNVGNILSVKQ